MLSDAAAQALTVWTARAAALAYVAALVLLLRRRDAASRIVTTLGFTVYLVHVACAFTFFYNWSHTTAYIETARQTRELFRVDSGAGIWLNYLFTAVWGAECLVAWRTRRLTRARIGAHAFLLFIVLNATVVVWILRATVPQ